MASLDSTITITNDLRTCRIHGKNALFHRFIETHSCDLINALVEYSDGSVGLVNIEDIYFTDYKFKEYELNDRW